MSESFRQEQADNIINKFSQNSGPSQQEEIDNIISKFDNNQEQNFVDSINRFAPKERVSKLIEAGVLCDLGGYEWGCLGGDRFYVFANINGVPVPMYKTSARTDNKREDIDFFPFFGTQTSNQDWLIKGDTAEDTNNFYGIKSLEEVAKTLTEVFNFNTDRIRKDANINFKPGVDSPWEKFIDVDNFVPDGKEVESSKKLNELIGARFNVDFDKINQMPAYSTQAVKYISGNIFKRAV